MALAYLCTEVIMCDILVRGMRRLGIEGWGEGLRGWRTGGDGDSGEGTGAVAAFMQYWGGNVREMIYTVLKKIGEENDWSTNYVM